MSLPFAPPLEPMLAEAQDEIPAGPGWRYEPKWDGFRAIVFRDGESVYLSSREGKPLARYFPEVCAALAAALPHRCIVDGEIILAGEKGLDFDSLQQRLHPAASRVNKLSVETPASFVVFDVLAMGDDDWRGRPFSERRAELERWVSNEQVFVTPQTAVLEEAKGWFRDFEGAGCDGVIARREALSYRPGERVMVKVKHGRFADVVVGGYREGKKPGTVGSLLLGLYDERGVLHHVGHTSSFSAKEKAALLVQLVPLKEGDSFGQGRTPGGPSRWTVGKDMTWVPLKPVLVCEVRYDFVQSGRFRHASTFIRWRTDKSPTSCTMAQLEPPNPFLLQKIIALTPKSSPR